MPMNPIDIANVMAQAAQQKAQSPNAKSPKQVAAAKEQEKSKGKKPPQKKPMPPQDGQPPQGGRPPQGMPNQ